MRCISRSKISALVYASRRTRSGSTILLISGMASRSMGFSSNGYVVFQVGAHALQGLVQLLDLGLRQSGEGELVQPLHRGPYLLEQLAPRWGELQPRHAQVLAVG